MTAVLEFKTTEEKEIDEHRKAFKQIAKLNWIAYSEHVAVGFTPEQAMQFLLPAMAGYEIDY
jgi:hypothetical protein